MTSVKFAELAKEHDRAGCCKRFEHLSGSHLCDKPATCRAFCDGSAEEVSGSGSEEHSKASSSIRSISEALEDEESTPVPSTSSSPLKGIHSTGSLEHLEGSLEGSSPEEGSNEESDKRHRSSSPEAQSQYYPATSPPREESSEDVDSAKEMASTAPSIREQGIHNEGQDPGSASLSETGSSDREEKHPSADIPTAQDHAYPGQDAASRLGAHSSSISSLHSRGSEAQIEARGNPLHSPQGYPVYPTTESDTGTLIYHTPATLFADRWPLRDSSSESQAAAVSDSAPPSPAGSPAEVGITLADSLEDNVEQMGLMPSSFLLDPSDDPWDAHSSGGDSNLGYHPLSLQPSLSMPHEMPARTLSGAGSLHLQRRRSSTSGVFRGADRALEEAGRRAEELNALSKQTLSPEPRFSIADTVDQARSSDSGNSIDAAMQILLERGSGSGSSDSSNADSSEDSHGLLESSDPWECVTEPGDGSSMLSSMLQGKDDLRHGSVSHSRSSNGETAVGQLCEELSNLGL